MILVDIYVHMAVDGVRVRDLIVKHVSRLRPWRNCQKRLQLARRRPFIAAVCAISQRPHIKLI